MPLRRRFLEIYKKARIIHWGWINTSFSISPSSLSSCPVRAYTSLTTRGSGWVFFLKEWPINFEKPFCEKSIAQKWNEGIYAKKGMRAWYYWRRRLLLPHTDDASSKCIWGCRLLFPYYLTYFEKKSIFLEENFSDLNTRYFAHMHNYLIDPISTKRGAQAALTQFWNVCVY